MDATDYSYYFLGCVPAHGIFSCRVKDLDTLIADVQPGTELPGREEVLLEVCFVGITAYFQAFCKDNFASIVNICPNILGNLVVRRPDLAINVSAMLKVLDGLSYRLGSIVAEQLDVGKGFGNAKEINGLYEGLLGITPLGTNEKRKLDGYISDRNLLVHHGGIYSTNYQHREPIKEGKRLHADSLIITKEKYEEYSKFLSGIAKKIATASQSALQTYITSQSLTMSAPATDAIEALTWDNQQPELFGSSV